jgi:hypothetical protein
MPATARQGLVGTEGGFDGDHCEQHCNREAQHRLLRMTSRYRASISQAPKAWQRPLWTIWKYG